MLLAVCPLAAALQTGFIRPGLVQPPSFATGPARSARAAAMRLPAAVVMQESLHADSPGDRSGLPEMVATEATMDDLTQYYEGSASLDERMKDYVMKRGGDRVIRRILIANNGMAATKSIMSIRQWGYNTFGDERAVQFVVMATPEDLKANAEFIRRADEFVEVPGGSNANNYANVQLIVDLCLSQNVDAVMVGWGHASENPKLGDMLKEKAAQMGKEVTFIGPTSPVMRVLGDKIGSNLVAQKAGVSTMPWNGDGMTADLDEFGNIPFEQFDAACIHTEEEAVDAANRIGYPVMLKASEGGGGKGIRMARDEAALRTAYPQVLGEVPGSPVFLVQLCQGARHLEVQVMGDKHGNAIALGGRDCSTQRRFQKIFEEGPPIVADDDVFIEMQRAAVNLCRNLGYVSAGTVEYMYMLDSKEFYFLELNPRLQVEHPVSESITGVSMPGTQLHVAMGIPLHNIPEVREFYDEDKAGIGRINLDYFKPNSAYPRHCIAARITAENPDEGFKPTSGKIERIVFQSNQKVWGYFSVIADGGVHEYADSQFGHIFANAATREESRRALVGALKELFILGEIRTTVEYLGELLETDAFKENIIDTAWLDGIIAEKSVSVEVDSMSAVINAAVYRGWGMIQDSIDGFKASLEMGQLSLLPLREMQQIPLELTYEDVKYSFKVSPRGPDTILLSIGEQEIEVKILQQADGSLFVSYGRESHQVFAREEPLGLRMVLDGVTVLLPTVYDPSELRSDITGKLVRYLVEDGAEVEAGTPFAEAEAMKMLITIKASEAGKITHEKQPGSIINQGDLLSSLELKDPSKVKKILPFDGELSFEKAVTASKTTLQSYRSSLKSLELVMDGYVVEEVDALVQEMLASLQSLELLLGEVNEAAASLANKLPAELDGQLEALYAKTRQGHVDGEDSAEALVLVAALKKTVADFIDKQFDSKKADMAVTLSPISAVIDTYENGLRDHAVTAVCALIQRYMGVEASFFSQPSTDQAMAALIKANADSLDQVVTTALAHESLKARSALTITLLRQLYDFPERFGVAPLRELPPALDVVVSLAQLPGQAYKEVALTATQFGLNKAEKPFEEVVAELKQELKTAGADSTAVSRGLVVNALLALFGDEEVGQTAMQVAVKRFYRAFKLLKLETTTVGEAVITDFEYQGADNAQGDANFPVRGGQLAVVPSLASLQAQLTDLLGRFPDTSEPVNKLHVALSEGVTNGAAAEEALLSSVEALLKENKAALEAKGVRLVSLMVPNPPKWPRQYSFTVTGDWAEDEARRGMYPTMWDLLELSRLENWSPERLSGNSRNSVVLLGQQGSGRGQQQRVYVRGVTHAALTAEASSAEASLLKSLDELQLAMLDKRVSPTASSHLFLHALTPFDTAAEGVIKTFEEVMPALISKYATRLLNLRVDEIEIRAHATEGSGQQAIRLMASSMSGQWLKTDGYLEFLDPTTGETQSYCEVADKDSDEQMCYLEPYAASTTLTNKRSIARRIGTTYAYDFIGLIEKALVSQWQAAISSGAAKEMPLSLLAVDELLLEGDALVRGSRMVGENTVGMVGWHLTLKTPEYPDGRPLVIVANDCTVQSGSFGVDEDIYFDKVSKYARAGGFPRLHIASNSGARIGLAEEVKPYFQIAWNDPANEANGYKYLYLSEADLAKLPEGVVSGEFVTEGGEKRYKLNYIVGEKDGIGVENLRGSGLIAGETSAAYADTFTLSYVTGRSVGIGAYVNRLAQRVIQMSNGPIILTGFSALNKLLGKEVYVSQDQLGGPQIMLPNGVAHQLASDDQDGVEKILRWLSYVPYSASSLPSFTPSSDPVERPITFLPSKTPYDPRNMLAGAADPNDGTWLSGFFDKGSFTEYLADWGKSVVMGRGKLGGVPMGCVAVETRLVEQRIPADPANPASRESVLAQAGQVWYPDSAFKTAQAIQDFAGENLPLMIFANWRGFSGGTRDMYGEILKFGAFIVDNLRNYKQPVFVYIPPNGELRGGAWVVVDPTINEAMMEMYADENARGGILEPPGICDVKFRKPDLIKAMHRQDSKLQQLAEELEVAESSFAEAEAASLRKQISAREVTLLPLYVQVSHEFADLHDRPGRMVAKGVIRDVVPWAEARPYFYHRMRRRLAQDALIKALQAVDAGLLHKDGVTLVQGWCDADWGDDKAVLEWFESAKAKIDELTEAYKVDAVGKTVGELLAGLSTEAKAALLKSL
jgi:acetyl-CoA carboxylase/biotin carboxylase 1